MKTTTTLNTLFDPSSQRIITGNENYPVFSNDNKPLLTSQQVKDILKLCADKKLNKFYSCIEKAILVAEYLKLNSICFGSLFVDSTEEGASYGFYYNPPLEFHAWVSYNSGIIDFGLAGVIENGLQIKDHIGYILKDRIPCILAGFPSEWMHYQRYKTILIKDVSLMDKEDGRKLLKYYL